MKGRSIVARRNVRLACIKEGQMFVDLFAEGYYVGITVAAREQRLVNGSTPLPVGLSWCSLAMYSWSWPTRSFMGHVEDHMYHYNRFYLDSRHGDRNFRVEG